MGSSPCFAWHSKRQNLTKDDIKTIINVNEYEDEHIRVKVETTKEIVNGNLKNITGNRYIYNKDGYYKPQFLLASGKNE